MDTGVSWLPRYSDECYKNDTILYNTYLEEMFMNFTKSFSYLAFSISLNATLSLKAGANEIMFLK